MTCIADVYERLMKLERRDGITLALSENRSLITITVDNRMVVTADDDLMGFTRRYKRFGFPCETNRHVHPVAMEDIYQQLACVITETSDVFR